jgi:hypothetical protein
VHIAVGCLLSVSWLVTDMLLNWELGLVAVGWKDIIDGEGRAV